MVTRSEVHSWLWAMEGTCCLLRPMCENQLEKKLAKQLLFVCLSELPSKRSRSERSQRPILALRDNAMDPTGVVAIGGIADIKGRVVLAPRASLTLMHQCIRPLIGGVCAPGHHGYQRACDLITGQASTGHLGHQCSHAPGRPILHLVFILSQTSAGKTFRGLALRSRGRTLSR